MANFFKKGDTPDNTALVNATYPDLYDNNQTTADIQNGTVNEIMDVRLFIADFKMPATPAFGSAELVGAKAGFYINSITGASNQASVLKAFKLNTEIGNNEGGKASSTGSLVSNKDIVQISSYHSNDFPYIHEDMTGVSVPGSSWALGYTFPTSDKGKPIGFYYLEKEKGYDFGNDYGGESLSGELGIVPYSREDHFNMFGTVHPELGEVYIMREARQEVFMRTQKKWTAQDGYQYAEKYSGIAGFAGIELNSGGIFPHLKYYVPNGANLTDILDIERESVSTVNSIFTSVSEAKSFAEVNSDGELKEIAYGYITKSDFANKGNNSIHFNSVYPHRFNSTAQVYYPKRYDTVGTALIDGSENQQVSHVSTIVPKPAHLYTRQPTTGGDGRQPVTPVVEIDINIEDLAPMLIRNQNSSYAEPNHDYRLTRSITITFGEEPARRTDNLHTYLKRHAPNANQDGTGSGTGLGTSAKSFFGLSFVNHDGLIGYYNLGNAGKSSSTYTDSTFVLDGSRGEVCFANAPTTNFDSEALLGSWFTLAIQLHPDDQGAVWCAYNPDEGDILTENTPYTTQKLTNLKNITASSSGVWANNTDDFPKYMTIWNSNYQSIKGKYNTDAEMYETGLRAVGNGSSATTLNVHGVYNATNANDSITNATGDKHASYLLLDRSDDIHLALQDGTSDSGLETITECLNSVNSSNSAGQYTVTTASWSDGDYVYYAPKSQIPDGQITQDNFDCRNSFYVDEIRFKSFSMLKSNATPVGGSAIGKLEIPQAAEMPNTAWQDGSSTVSNVTHNLTRQPSYLCFGFDNLTDITGPHGLGSFTNATCDTNHTSNTTTITHDADSRIVAGLQVSGTGIPAGAFIVSITDTTHFVISAAATATNNNQTLTFEAVKFLHLNDYKSSKIALSENIITNDDSDVSNIRVGYSSSVEKYGRQNAANSTAGSVPDTGSAESPVFSNNETSPNDLFRGLVVGDLDTAANEFSVEANGSGNDGVGNVDYFSQKGLMKFRFGYRSDATSTKTDNAGNAAVAEGHVEFKVTDGKLFAVKDYILVGSEIMKIDNIVDDDGDGDFTKATLTVRRGQHGTTPAEHADNVDVTRIAMPEKRECIFTSSRILDRNGKNSLLVDDPSIFRNKASEEYIIYKYDDSHAAPSGVNVSDNEYTTFKVTSVSDEGVVSFDKEHNLSNKAVLSDYLISPYRYWLIVEILNVGGAHGWQDDTSSTKVLPPRSYKNAVQLFEKGTYGTTFNETLFTDAGDYANKWHIQTYDNSNNGVASLKDYGFGEFDEELNEGGHCGLLALNVNEAVNTYQFMDLGNLVQVDKHKGSDIVPLIITTKNPLESFKINIDTEIGTNKPYLLAEYEDAVPTVTSFNAQPNEENPYNVDFTWECADDDVWYGFLIIDERNINSQYHSAVIHLPMNEEGNDGVKATTPVEQIQGMTTSVDSTSSTGPFYDIEGLAGYALRFDRTGTPDIEIGTGGENPLGSTGHTVTDEMTINIHFRHDADADGTLDYSENLIMSTERFFLEIQTDGTVKYRQYWDTNSYVELQTASRIATDGNTPNNIMITFDANLTSGNLKMFMDGKLEDQSGEVILADSGTANTGWLYGANLETNNNKIHLGNQIPGTANDEFQGVLEEFVIYNKCLYPVNVKSGKFTLTKPFEEVATTSSFTTSKSYTARLFVKDYHNIRGTTTDEVASSSNVSFKKAAFRFDNS